MAEELGSIRDYRVRVGISMEIDLGVKSRREALMKAEGIVRQVFAESFGRAFNVTISAHSAFRLQDIEESEAK